jgi:predicted DNA-binding transcriptional regulator AlpA
MSVVGMAELASILGVSRQRAAQLAVEHADFPQPLAELRSGRVWDEAAVRAWVDAHPYRPPGRPRRSPARQDPS